MKNLESIVDKCARLKRIIDEAQKDLKAHANELKDYASENNLKILDGIESIAIIGEGSYPCGLDKKKLKKEFPEAFNACVTPSKGKYPKLTFKSRK